MLGLLLSASVDGDDDAPDFGFRAWCAWWDIAKPVWERASADLGWCRGFSLFFCGR